ncbi:hypothetical protein [Mycoplasma testudineum]|uniref:hypothetical protein n=1 Tax=Mycoplasma testudineum TaxID=244584 RepID=UPI000B93F09C|nr:hypothetical protein [Mycoplasma testudineum]OYD26890.1 hypothetical protein CG473_00940 [Mycoplasma testudineum]
MNYLIPNFINEKVYSGTKVEYTMQKIKRDKIDLYSLNIAKDWSVDIGFGGYLEKREFYFNDNQSTSFIHAGVDVFFDNNLDILAPFNARVLSFKSLIPNNEMSGRGSGGVLSMGIERSELRKYFSEEKINELINDKNFMVLIFIHLKTDSFELLNINHLQKELVTEQSTLHYSDHDFKNKPLFVKKNQVIAKLASKRENGGWSPHLHIEAYATNELSFSTSFESALNHNILLHSAGTIDADKQNIVDFKNLYHSVNPIKIFDLNNTIGKYELTIDPYGKENDEG